MFESTRRVNSWSLLFSLFSVTYHTAVRKVRKTHGNAMVAIGMSLLQSFMFLAAFYLMFTVIGARTMAIRGDFMLYLLTGIYMYLVHIQALQAVLASENSTSPMMQHAPMNTLVAILSSALSVLYVKTISLLVVLFTMHTLIQPIEIYDWSSAMMMYLLAWGSGCAIGLILMALKPWAPDVVTILQLVYVRANMIASGKMFVANTLPGFMLAMFDWNPLFHIIDQTRGLRLRQLQPRTSSNWQYPLYVTLDPDHAGMMGEFFTRKRASISWNARR
jgi:ABC-type polysaccharide/polyol phosphate export permease